MSATMSRAVLADEVLIERTLAGSKECFDALYERHFPRVYNFVSRRVGDTSEAEDLTQEIFIQAVTSLSSYRAEGSFLHWMYGITRNVLKRHYLRKMRAAKEIGTHRVDVSEDPESLHDEVTPERQASARESGRRTMEALESLDPESREMYLLHHVDGVSIRDLSERTLRTEDAIKSDLYRIRKRITEEN